MDEELRAELLRRVTADQEARQSLDHRAVAAADGENLPWLRRVIAGVGLSPLAWYLARMAAHRAPAPMRVPCHACQAVVEVWAPERGEARTATCPGCGLLHTFRREG